MKKAFFVLVCVSAGLTACQNDAPAVNDAAQNTATATSEPAFVPSTPEPAAQSILTLTDQQLLDASIVDTAGMDIGDVEGIVRDASGKIEKFLVEVEASDPDKFVHLEIGQVTAVKDGNDWDLRAPLTREDLMAMPSVPR